jgi:SAM-dependent methyltransferase
MLHIVEKIVRDTETRPDLVDRDQVLASLRRLGLDDFGALLMLMPDPQFPRLSSILPAMASAEIQNAWTGNNGYPLLRQTCNFVRSVVYNFTQITKKTLENSYILDYGCGYGRIARLMYYFCDTQHVIGVDPWDRSIEECRAARLGPNCLLSDYLPESLPVGALSFDLAYAFSVFTHLSKRATMAALAAVRQYMKPGGVFCITIRPAEYWDQDSTVTSPAERMALKAKHFQEGFAFVPHGLAPIDGDITYGDTSMSLEWLDSNLANWTRVRIDRSLEDGLQIYVFLQAS